MNLTAASALLLGSLLIEPGYAKAHSEVLLQLIKDQVADSKTLFAIRSERSTEEILLAPAKKIYTSKVQSEIYLVNPYTSVDRLPYDCIVIIDVIGPVMKYGSWYSWGTLELTDLIIRMANTEKVKGILLNIDSPGGQAAGTAEFSQTIREVTRLKPVIAVVQDGIAASAAIWILSGAQEAYVTQPTDQVGSIGAYNTIFDIYAYFAAQGLPIRDIYAPQSVDKNQDYIQALQGDDTLVKEDLKFLVDHFISMVKTNRGQRISMQGDEPFTGKMYNADVAKKFGLIDGMKPMAAVVKRLEQLIALRA